MKNHHFDRWLNFEFVARSSATNWILRVSKMMENRTERCNNKHSFLMIYELEFVFRFSLIELITSLTVVV